MLFFIYLPPPPPKVTISSAAAAHGGRTIADSTAIHLCSVRTNHHTSSAGLAVLHKTHSTMSQISICFPTPLEPQQALLLLRQACLYCCQVGQNAVTCWATQPGPGTLRLIEPAQLRYRICRGHTMRADKCRGVKGGASGMCVYLRQCTCSNAQRCSS
jgi:hypothetical protein